MSAWDRPSRVTAKITARRFDIGPRCNHQGLAQCPDSCLADVLNLHTIVSTEYHAGAVGSYATVHLADGREVCSFRDGVDQLFFILFTSDERYTVTGPEAYELLKSNCGDLDPDECVVAGFRSTAGAIRDRLDLLGVDEAVLAESLQQIVGEALAANRSARERFPSEEFAESRDREESALEGLTWERWAEVVREAVESGRPLGEWGGRFYEGSARWLMGLWEYHDERYAFRALLEVLDPDEQITLDVSQLDLSWVEDSVDPQEFARGLVAYATEGGLPPVVLTEGTFDAQVLTAAIRIRRPHLVGFLRLPDFSRGLSGGSAELRQTIRGLAAAGVPNRVVGLFDNDSAGRDGARPLSNSLPDNIAFTFLPELALAVDYPTIGPQGATSMDINGLAVSIELYLGADVLTVDGELVPVEWSSYIKAVESYQGAVQDKKGIQDRWRAKVRAVDKDPSLVELQDWSGIDLLLDHLMETIKSVRHGGR